MGRDSLLILSILHVSIAALYFILFLFHIRTLFARKRFGHQRYSHQDSLAMAVAVPLIFPCLLGGVAPPVCLYLYRKHVIDEDVAAWVSSHT